jgi:hypothetical protein
MQPLLPELVVGLALAVAAVLAWVGTMMGDPPTVAVAVGVGLGLGGGVITAGGGGGGAVVGGGATGAAVVCTGGAGTGTDDTWDE